MKQHPRITTDYQALNIPEKDYLALIDGLVDNGKGITVEFFILQTTEDPYSYGKTKTRQPEYALGMKQKQKLNYNEVMSQLTWPDTAEENKSLQRILKDN